jgi:hypothetical protein
MTKILVATPAYGEMFYTPYVSSLVRLQRLMMRHKWEMTFISISYADIVESRNFLLTHWYDKTDATHLLFIDADMGYEAQLVADMVQLDRPVVGVVYPKRQINLERLAERAAEGQPFERARAQAHDFIVRRGAKSRQVIRNGFIAVEGCGTGLFLIRRDCITEMLRKMPELTDTSAPKNSPIAKTLDRLIRAFDHLITDGMRLSEDFSFCHRWRQCGGEIWANITHEVTHVGLQRFAARYQAARGPRISIGKPVGPTARAGAPAKQASRERQLRPRGTRAAPVDDGEPVTREQMALTFLRAQIDSPRWGNSYLALMRRLGLVRSTLIDEADLSDAEQNRHRATLLARASGYLFRGFPSDATWKRRTLGPEHLDHLKYMKCEPWLTLSGGTRSVTDGAGNLGKVRLTKGAEARRTSAAIVALMEKIRAGARYPDLIAVDGENDLILLEGHARATAYAAARIETPVGILIGSSPAMKQWAYY